jgi:aryl-alcohol dehydrogenase-like predicted oxidoreductase
MSQWDDARVARRDVLQAALLAGAGLALSGCASTLAASANASSRLITKRIPSTGERIPAIGIGANRFSTAQQADVDAVLKRAHELGGTVIDTAGRYPRSEEMIGQALADLQLGSRMFISTKVNASGATNDPPHDLHPRLPPEMISAPDSFERSLRRLRTDRVDLLMAHWLSSVDLVMPMMLDLKRAGRVRYIGCTTITPQQHPRLAAFVEKYPVDFVQLAYSLSERAAEKDLLPLAQERRIAVSVALPFGGEDASMFTKVANRELPSWAADYDIKSWAQFFLKYAISHPAVTVAVPGSTKLSHLEDNQLAGRGRLPDAAGRRKMEQFWDALS